MKERSVFLQSRLGFIIPFLFPITGPQSTLLYEKYLFSSVGLSLLFVEEEEKAFPQATTAILSFS